jgi:hypothetical protein
MHYPHRAPSGPWEHLSPGQPCSPRLHGSPAHRARPACMAALLTLPQREKKPTGRVLGYSAESALLLVVRAIPSAPSLFTTVVATVLERMQFAHSLLSFCTSFSQFSRCGLATPSHRDGSCAGSPVCRQPVLRTLCLTNSQGHAWFDESVMEGPAIRALIAAAVPCLALKVLFDTRERKRETIRLRLH